MSDRFEELRRSFDEDREQPYDHDLHEQSSEDVLSALVEPEDARPSLRRSLRRRPSRSQSRSPSRGGGGAGAGRAARAAGLPRPDGYATLEGSPTGAGALGRRRRQPLQRRDHDAACSRRR